ncbi:MAG: hypothetical protein QXF15_03635, partial [Candidatus Aenigmatarchaeota archaeon]
KGRYGQLGRKKKKEEGMINMSEQNPEIPELENLFKEYDNLPNPIKKIVNNYLSNKFGISIDDIKNNPELLLEIITKLVKPKENKPIEQIEKKENNNEIRI